MPSVITLTRVSGPVRSVKRIWKPTARADGGAELCSDPAGDGACSDASRLRVADQAKRSAARCDADLRQLRRLAGTRRSADDDQLPLLQRVRDLLAMRDDRQRRVVLDFEWQSSESLDARERIVDRLVQRIDSPLRLRIRCLASEQPVQLARQPRPIRIAHPCQPLAQSEQRRIE
jgi:hypothetical protein